MENETLETVENEIAENSHTIAVVAGYAAAAALIVVGVRKAKSWYDGRKAAKAIEETIEENE